MATKNTRLANTKHQLEVRVTKLEERAANLTLRLDAADATLVEHQARIDALTPVTTQETGAVDG